jgi:molybdopterin converting factor small subunit
MAAIYDPQGNYIGDDGAPDLDQMKLELVKKNQPLSSQIPGYGRPVPPSQTPPDPLGAAAGNFTELATKFNPLMMAKSMREAAGMLTVPPVAAIKGVGESLLTSPAGTYTSGKAPDYAEQVAKQFMQQNAPQTPMAQEFANAIAPTMQNLPAYLGHLQTGRPAFTPNDLRVMGAEATRVGRQVKDIPTDFVNAQSGMQRLDPITGQPTYGAKLQGVAESVGDIAAARRAEGKSLIPGIPDIVTPEASLYAVRPQGSRLVRPTVPEGANLSRTWDKEVLEDVSTRPMSPSGAWNVIDNTVLAQGPQRTAFRKFMEDKYKEMYPDAPSVADAKEAFQTMYNDRDVRAAKVLEFYDEFLQAPEGSVVGANNLLTPTEVKARHDAASQWLNSNLINYIQKNVGTEGDPLVKAASEGLTFLPSEKYENALQSTGGKSNVEENRRRGNMPIEGSLAEPIAKKEFEFAEAQSRLNEIESKRRNLADIAMKQGLPDPAMLPEYAALTNPVRSAVRERDRIEEQLDNLKLGRKYEAAVDYGVTPHTAEDFLGRKLEYSERQFYPTVLKTPPQENVYRTYGAHLDALGFNKLAQSFYGDVMSGDIPLDKVGKMTVENYVRKTAKARIDEERLAKEAAKAYKRNAESALQQRARDLIPLDKTFGNAGMIELTKDTPEYDIIRTMSEDTAVLDHCVGQGGSARGSEDRNPWYGNSQRSYEPILDLVTGQPNPRASSDRTSYVNYVQNGDKIISVRDLTTGLPQATLHLEQSRIGNSGQQKYSIGYASGHQNGDIDAKYSGAIRDYLNSIADEIDSSGHNLQSHAGVFDMYDGDFLNAMRKELNISKQELSKYNLEDMLPRFMTVSDARAAIKAANLANAEPAKAELIELNAAIEDAMQEHADLMRVARRRPMDEADREHVAELEANINTMRQRIRDFEQLTPAVAPAPATNMTYRTPSLVEANTIIGSLDDVGNSQMIDLRNDVSERAREQFMNTYAELARQQGLTTVTIDNIADFGRALSGLRDDINAQIAHNRTAGFEGRAVAEAFTNVNDVLNNHIDNLATGPADDFAAQADALMAEPELFANAPAPRINNQDEVAQTIRDMAAQRTENLRQIDPDLGNQMDTIVTETAAFYSPATAPRRFANAIRGAGIQAESEALRNSLAALANTVDSIVDLADQLPAQLPAVREPDEFDPETFFSNYVEDLRRTMPTDDLIRFTREVENIAQFLNMRDQPVEFATRLRDAADNQQSEITELTLIDFANQIESRMAEQRAEQDRRDFEPAREQEVINMLDDPEIDPESLRATAFAMDGVPNAYWAPLSEGFRRDAAMQLRERANYAEFNPEDFATRLANEAGLNFDEMRDTVQALNDGQFDHEVLRGLPFAERGRAAQSTALALQRNMGEQAQTPAAALALAQRDPVRDTVRNADTQVLEDALTTTERARVSAAIDQALLSNDSFNGEEGISTARRLAQIIREYDIGFTENMMQVERELVARGIDAIADQRELGIGNQQPEVTPADQTDASMIATTLDESYYQDADSPQQALAQVNHHLLMLRDRPTAAFDAILGMASNDFTYSPALIQALINELMILSERYRVRAVGGNADGGPVRGYQAGGSVKKPDVPTPWLFSVPTYSETVAYEMYPGQKGQDDQRDAARHMLAAGTLSRKYGPKTAEFLGKAHEFTTSPLQAVKSMFGGQMPADYGMDTHNNRFGAELGQRAKSQAELEDLVQAEAERASRTQTQGQAFIKKANGGIVQQNPTTDQMRYALTMRRK